MTSPFSKSSQGTDSNQIDDLQEGLMLLEQLESKMTQLTAKQYSFPTVAQIATNQSGLLLQPKKSQIEHHNSDQSQQQLHQLTRSTHHQQQSTTLSSTLSRPQLSHNQHFASPSLFNNNNNNNTTVHIHNENTPVNLTQNKNYHHQPPFPVRSSLTLPPAAALLVQQLAAEQSLHLTNKLPNAHFSTPQSSILPTTTSMIAVGSLKGSNNQIHNLFDPTNQNNNNNNDIQSTRLQNRLALLLQSPQNQHSAPSQRHNSTNSYSNASVDFSSSQQLHQSTSSTRTNKSNFFATILSSNTTNPSTKSFTSTPGKQNNFKTESNFYLSDDKISSSPMNATLSRFTKKPYATPLNQSGLNKQSSNLDQQNRNRNCNSVTTPSTQSIASNRGSSEGFLSNQMTDNDNQHSTTPRSSVTRTTSIQQSIHTPSTNPVSNNSNTPTSKLQPTSSFLSLATATAQKRDKLIQLEKDLIDLRSQHLAKQNQLYELNGLIGECEKDLAGLQHSQFSTRISPYETLFVKELQSERELLTTKLKTCSQMVTDNSIILYLLESEYNHIVQSIDEFETDFRNQSTAFDELDGESVVDDHDNAHGGDNNDQHNLSHDSTITTENLFDDQTFEMHDDESDDPVTDQNNDNSIPNSKFPSKKQSRAKNREVKNSQKSKRAQIIRQTIDLIQILQYELIMMKLSDILIDNKRNFDPPPLTTLISHSNIPFSSQSLSNPSSFPFQSSPHRTYFLQLLQSVKNAQLSKNAKQLELESLESELDTLESTQSDLLDQIKSLTAQLNQLNTKKTRR